MAANRIGEYRNIESLISNWVMVINYQVYKADKPKFDLYLFFKSSLLTLSDVLLKYMKFYMANYV